MIHKTLTSAVLTVLLLVGLSATLSASPTVMDWVDNVQVQPFELACNSPTGIEYIHGVVTDSSTGNPLYSMKVTLQKASTGEICQEMTTNSSGQYGFNLVFTDQYLVMASGRNYTPQSKYCNGVNGDDEVDFQLVHV